MSVVVPARGAEATIAATLESIRRQDYDRVVDVIVAAGDDATACAVEAVAGMDVSVVPNPAGTTPAALNRAVASGSGEIVVRCDAHAVLPPGYITRAVDTLTATRAANVGGRQDPRGRTWFERAVAFAMRAPLGSGDARYRLGGAAGPVDTVYLGVFLREAMEAVGGFDETLERNQDYELNWRLRRAGHVVWFDPDLVVAYRPRGSVPALWRQYHQYGRWKREMVRRHPESLRIRQAAAPVLVAGLAGCALLAPRAPRLAAIPPLLYATSTIAAGVRDFVRTGDTAALGEPAALWTMHLAWGTGFFRGPPS